MYDEAMNYLYGRILEIMRFRSSAKPSTVNKLAHETLVLVCHEGLRDSGQAYGNLFSQVDYLCRRHHVRLPDRIAVQTMRRHTNSAVPLDDEDFVYDMRALCRFVSAVTGDDVPGELLSMLPANDRPYDSAEGLDVRYVRCIVREAGGGLVYASVESGIGGGLLVADCRDEEFAYLRKIVHDGMQLNLLDCKLVDVSCLDCDVAAGVSRAVVPGLVVVEPDYLVDISSVAGCFKEYGHHPLTYTLERMRRRGVTQPILLGNLAGSVLDDVVNEGDDFNLASTIRSNFGEKALEYCACNGFDAARLKQDIRAQAANMEKAVSVMFGEYDRSKVVLEPSFVCESLGLQGRVDMMTTDCRLLVEQKSGKNRNIETGRSGAHGSVQLEPHYVQLLLYYGVLRYNFNLGYDRTDIRLLYSKYPPGQGLVSVAFYRGLFREAMKLRNMIVATDFMIACKGFGRVLPLLTPETLNSAGLDNSFYHTWLLPRILEVTAPLQGLEPLERDYFCRLATFVYREQLLGKVGSQEGVSRSTADLWNMPLSGKIETGNIYVGLKITGKDSAGGGDVPNLVTLAVPELSESFLPNFRRGDMVYLYRYRDGEEPDVRRSILYTGCITDIHTAEITVALADGQKNPEILKVQDVDDGFCYAVEHAGTDSSAAAAMRSLYEFVTAPVSRRDLLLARRRPVRNPDVRLAGSYNEAYDEVLLRAKQARDYFLHVGPPGTGKTSMAIRFIVEEELSDAGASVLLMAYTNRAVDELCAMLDDAHVGYLRIGSEYSADPACKPHLLSEAVKTAQRLSDVRGLITSARVITGTTSMIMSRPYIFDIKHFTLAVVDEASQILEPGLVGLLAAHRHNERGDSVCRIDKFILTGDHKQLPAVVQQSERESAVDSRHLRDICLDNCRNSLFERLLRIERAAGSTDFVGVLRRHGRMHPDVARFPCHEFYADEHLQPVPLQHQKETALNYADIGIDDSLDTLLRTQRMIFIPSDDCRRPDLSDKVNISEAVIVADVLRRVRMMLGDGFNPDKSVGVIVPYRNQIAVIRKETERFGMPELENISIDTVERYQGSQRDVIIYSFTVQNAWQLEFLAGSCFNDGSRLIDRKLNVALTRARRQMIMTGNIAVLSRNVVFRKLIDYVKSKGGMAGCLSENK